MASAQLRSLLGLVCKQNSILERVISRNGVRTAVNKRVQGIKKQKHQRLCHFFLLMDGSSAQGKYSKSDLHAYFLIVIAVFRDSEPRN
jgi:hypothetical protein